MTLKYESELLFDLMKRDGDDTPSDVLPYESELKEKYLNQVVGAYPKLQDYLPEWLYYNLYHHLPSDFPVESVANVTSASFNNVVPYAYKSAILKGQTMVNIITKNSGTISRTSNNSRHNLHIPYHYKLIPNKKYYVAFKVSNITGDTTGVLTVSLCNGELSNQELEIKEGRFSIITTAQQSKEEYLHSLTIYFVANGTDTSCDISEIMVVEYQEGMENWDIPYFEGMQSVKMPVLTTVGKNLIDLRNAYSKYDVIFDIENHAIIGNDNNYNEAQFFVYLVKGGRYTLSTQKHNNSMFSIHKGIMKGYTETSKLYDDYVKNGAATFTHEYESGWYTIHSPIFKGVIDDYQLESGSVATSYEPFKSNILTTSEEVELRGIGEVQDTLDCLTGELVKNFGSLYFDGSENWGIHMTSETVVVYKLNLPNLNHNFSVNTSLANKIPVTERAWTGEKGISLLNQYVYLTVEQSIANTSDDFKKWISSIGGINLIYRLPQGTVKTVDLSCINEQGESETFRPIEGTMHVSTSSQTLTPLLDMSVPIEATSQNLMSFANIEEEE